MEATVVSSRMQNLDLLLEQLSLTLQLPETKYKNAEEKYRAVGEWLADVNSPLSGFAPDVYPQGSMLLQTTVKPRVGDEYDLDLVCHLNVQPSIDPLTIYQMVDARLSANKVYAQIIKRKKRCLRLIYAGDFHLDILPACPDAQHGGTCILVPDLQLRQWKESNPKGYGAWFHSRCRVSGEGVLTKAGVEPLPDNGAGTAKPALKRVVQLLKRHRDVAFDGDENAPRSIVLTTLAAHAYRGELLCVEALLGVTTRLNQAIAQTPGILQVRNPTNPTELFSEAWDTKSYARFASFMGKFQIELERLQQTESLPGIAQALNELFGEEPTKKAVDAYTRRYVDAREAGKVGVAGPTASLAVGTSPKRPVVKTTFYGR